MEQLPSSEIIFYQTEDGQSRLEVRFDNGTLWLSLNQIAELFQTTKQNINLHILNIFEEGEISREATVKKYLTVQKEGAREVKRQIEYFNLSVILAVGYRVRSIRGTQFRQWATAQLHELLLKGFVLDKERLKNPQAKKILCGNWNSTQKSCLDLLQAAV